MKYKIAIKEIGAKQYKRKEIEAEPIVIKGYEEFKFIYHDSRELYTCFPKVISEVKCGAMVAEGKNKRECMKRALANLRTISKDEFRKMIKDFLKKVKPKKKKAPCAPKK